MFESLGFRRFAAGASVLTLAASAALVMAGPAAAADTSPPTQPGPIAVANVTSSAAGLSWARSTDNVAIEGYRVYRGSISTPDSGLSLIATTDAVTSYPAANLRSGTAYKFGVMAIDPSDNMSALTTVTLTTASSSDTTAPAAPSSSSVSAKAFSSSRIDVIWGASTSTDVSGYLVLRDGVQVGRIDLPGGLHYSDTGLAAASSHTYAVKTVDSAGNTSAATTGRTANTLAAGTVLITRGPYLSNVTETSAVVTWWSNLATAGQVGYGTSTASDQTVTDPAGSVQEHSVALSGLTAGTLYKYQVTSGSVTSGATFRTAAPAGTTFSFAAIGDFGGGSSGETQNAANIASANTSFIQTLGDNIYPSSGLPDPNYSTAYSDFDARFFKPFGAAVKTQSFFPANGNKEYYGDGEFWQAFPMLGTSHSWYSYNWGDAHILVLDSEQPFSTGSDQYNFVQADLAAHQSEPWRIVAIQRPPFSSTTANSSSKPVQQYLDPLFEQYNVALVLSGNSHNYERTYPLKGGVQASGGVTYVVSGGGGNGFNAFSGTPPAYSAFRESSYYEYSKVTVSPTSIQVDAIRADTNAVFDSTTISSAAPTVAPPTNLTATAVGSTELDLTWTASSSAGVTGYNVYRGGTKLTPSPVAGTTYNDTGLTASTTYSYQVTAVGPGGVESAPASVSAATGAGSVSSVTIVPTADATISSVSPTTNYGSASTLSVDKDGPIQDFLLRFAVPSTCTPTAGNLTLTVGAATNNNSAHGGDFYATADNGWTESAVTWSTAPALTGTPVSVGAVALGAKVAVNVTGLLGSGIHSGMFTMRVSTTSADAAVYVSRNATGTNGPSLQLTCG